MSGDRVRLSIGPCEVCGRPMRRRHDPPQEGLICAQRTGLCKPCYMRGRPPVEQPAQPRRRHMQPNQAGDRATVTIPLRLPPIEILDQAVCAQIGPGADGTFFPDYGDASGSKLAKAICATCSVIDQCREWALDNHEQHGIWGGLGPRERKRVLRERREAA